MLKIKPVFITILTVVCFAGGMALGTTSDWWQTEGRKTPLDGAKFYESHEEEAETDAEAPHETTTLEDAEEVHEAGTISGGTTVQQALDLGVPADMLEELLAGSVDNPEETIQAVAKERGLQFGVIKDELNAFLGQ